MCSKYQRIESITRLFFFQVGIGDGMPDGLCGEDMEASHATLQSLAESINADLSLLREKQAEASTFTITPLSRSLSVFEILFSIKL